jgi:hypothetical protein
MPTESVPEHRDSDKRLVSTPIAFDVPQAVVTSHGLSLPANLSRADWEAAGAALGRLRGRLRWLVGDWLVYGIAAGYVRECEDPRGDPEHSVYDAVAKLTGYSVQSLYDCTWIARRFEISRRREILAWGHHREVAQLTPEDADRWLDRAEAEGWSVHALRHARQAAWLAAQEAVTHERNAVSAVAAGLRALGPPPPVVEPEPPTAEQVQRKEFLAWFHDFEAGYKFLHQRKPIVEAPRPVPRKYAPVAVGPVLGLQQVMGGVEVLGNFCEQVKIYCMSATGILLRLPPDATALPDDVRENLLAELRVVADFLSRLDALPPRDLLAAFIGLTAAVFGADVAATILDEAAERIASATTADETPEAPA